MKCHLCQANKLKREFPSQALTEDCEHAQLHCLRCVTEHVGKNGCCSVCSEPVTNDNPQYQECINTLNRLFPEIEAPQTIQSTSLATSTPTSTSTGNETVTVAMMGGETVELPYQGSMTVLSLKHKIREHFGTEPHKQRLLYNEKELKAYMNVGSKLVTLQHYGVQPFSTINLIIVLFDIPETFDEVIFDLFWGYPDSGRDYLDASVLLYSGPSFIETVDYRRMQSKTCTAVCHSGDSMDDDNRLGHHTINVKLKSMREDIDKLFFTLSAWNCPNISKYRKPSLRFYDARAPKEQLCSNSMQHAANSQAIIMCGLCRIEGAWKVLSLLHVSNGNAKNYDPLRGTILHLIQKGTV